jgi:ABC-type phosphate transport system substrate-binding protein
MERNTLLGDRRPMLLPPIRRLYGHASRRDVRHPPLARQEPHPHRLSRWGVLLLAAVLIPLSAAATDVAVVTSTARKGTQLSVKEVRNIFLGRTKVWNDGTRIRVAVLSSGETHTRFLKALVDRSPLQFRRYWRKIVFSGKGLAPRIFDTEARLLAYVAATEGAIGYLSRTTVNGTVHVVSIKKENP